MVRISTICGCSCGNYKKNSYNAYCTQKPFFVEKYFESWDPKTHIPRNYLHSFYVAAIVEECGTKKHYPLAMFRNGIPKIRDHLIKAWWTMELLFCLLILKWHPRKRKIAAPRLEKIKMHFYSLKTQDDEILRIGQKYLPLY